MSDSLHRRVRQIRRRALVRAWEYRQRDLTNGVWFRLRRTLADAAEVWLIDEHDADRLEVAGYASLSVGRELDPRKRMFFVSRSELGSLTSGRQIPVRLSAELLQARSMALVPFDSPMA